LRRKHAAVRETGGSVVGGRLRTAHSLQPGRRRVSRHNGRYNGHGKYVFFKTYIWLLRKRVEASLAHGYLKIQLSFQNR